MRRIVCASLLALMLAAPAMAQTAPAAPAAPPAPAVSACQPVPPAPSLPDGATATREQMDAGNAAFAAWQQASAPALACRREEATASAQRARALLDELRGIAESATAAQSAWNTTSETYYTRFPRQRPREDVAEGQGVAGQSPAMRRCYARRQAQDNTMARQEVIGGAPAGAREAIQDQFDDCVERARREGH